MQTKFSWVLENFSSLQDKECYSSPYTIAGCNWRLLAYPRGIRNDRYYFSVYLVLAAGSLPPGWRREVKYRITLENIWPNSDKVLGGQCYFDANGNSFGFEDFLPLYKLRNGFLVDDRLTIHAEVHVFPALVVPVLDPVKIIASLTSNFVSKSQGDSPCQVAQETDNVASQENLDDDDASEEGTDDDDDDDASDEESLDDDDASQEDSDDDDDDDASQEDSDDDDDDASEESLDDDDASQEDPDDDNASTPVYDDGGSDISPLNQSNALEDASHTVGNHGIRCNSVAAETEVSNGQNDDAPELKDVDDEASSLVSNDSARNETSPEQVKSLEDASQTVENGGMGFNTVASVTEIINVLRKEIQPVKETMDINGFEVVSSKVESVRRIFERHPDIAVEFRAKNQHLRNACMNFLLSVMETMCQSLEELSNEDLVEADIALTYLRDAGFKVDWLEEKLDKLKENKEEEQSGLARLHEIEEILGKWKQQCSELEALAEKEKAELSATRSCMSFDDLV